MDEFRRRLIVEAILGFKPEVKQTLVEICKDPNASLERISERVFIDGVPVSSNTVKNYARVIYASLHINDKSEISSDICEILQQIERGEITAYSPFETELPPTSPESEGTFFEPSQSIDNERQTPIPIGSPQLQQQPSSTLPFLQDVPRTWLSIIIAAASIFGFVLCWFAVLGARNIFTGDEPDSTEPIAIVQSEATEAPSTIAATRISEPTDEPIEEVEETAVPTDTPEPTSTSTATGTPTPIKTPIPTITPTATITPTTTPSPTPSIPLPWEDNFEDNELSPPWKLVSGETIFVAIDGNKVLKSAGSTVRNPTCLILEIGDRTLNNFYIEMDYGAYDEGEREELYSSNDNDFEITFNGSVRARYDPWNSDFIWEEGNTNTWRPLDTRGGFDFEIAQHAKHELHADGTYITLVDGGVFTQFTYGSVGSSGPITIKLCHEVYIDNVRIGNLP